MMGDGGKWVCGLEHIQKKKNCVIYSFGKPFLPRCIWECSLRFGTSRVLILSPLGINGESSFEAELLEKAPGCQVWGYDFSVSGVSSQVVGLATVLILCFAVGP